MKKTDAKKIAKLYITSQLLLRDGFRSENLNDEDCKKVDVEVKEIANNLIKNFKLDKLPLTSDDCVDFVQKNIQ